MHNMAEVECEGFLFNGTMSVELEDAPTPDTPENYFADSGMAGRILYGTPRCHRDKIRIGAPRIVFTGNVTARGDGSIRQWTAGFLQAISFAEWGAVYTDGKTINWRLNTRFGPLKDGYEDSLFLHHDRDFTGAQGQYEASVKDCDCPAQMFFKEYSGDPLHPGSGAPVSRMAFRTYLAAVNRVTKSVVTLWENHWTLTWDGRFESGTNTWTPACGEQVIQQEGFNWAQSYPGLTATSDTPFSLLMETAKRSWEVRAGETWIPWINGAATTNEADRPIRRKWVR
jgi:hypothetical protein